MKKWFKQFFCPIFCQEERQWDSEYGWCGCHDCGRMTRPF